MAGRCAGAQVVGATAPHHDWQRGAQALVGCALGCGVGCGVGCGERCAAATGEEPAGKSEKGGWMVASEPRGGV